MMTLTWVYGPYTVDYHCTWNSSIPWPTVLEGTLSDLYPIYSYSYSLVIATLDLQVDDPYTGFGPYALLGL